MAIIEPEGLFHGDRLKKCSMTAQLFWPRFYLAANGHARLEINYSKLLDGPLASFTTPPSEADVWKMFQEYFINYLGFLYRCDGQVWCQFATDERLLPRHKTKSDMRSPDPPTNEYQNWLTEYLNAKKTTQVIDMTGLEIIPETFRKASEIPPKDFGEDVRGVGGGSGVGGGVGKRKSQKPSAKTAEDKSPDPRHAPIREYIKRCIEHATNLHPAPWDGRDGKSLDRLLSANPSWAPDVFIGLIKNRFRSEDIPRGDPAHTWLPTVAKFANGPLDRFGKLSESVKSEEKVKPVSAADEVRRQLQER